MMLLASKPSAKSAPAAISSARNIRLARYSNAFYAPIISDWRNNQQWQAAGKPEAWQKANAVYKQALEEYVEPTLDPARREELDAFVDRRKREGGAPTDF